MYQIANIVSVYFALMRIIAQRLLWSSFFLHGSQQTSDKSYYILFSDLLKWEIKS